MGWRCSRMAPDSVAAKRPWGPPVLTVLSFRATAQVINPPVIVTPPAQQGTGGTGGTGGQIPTFEAPPLCQLPGIFPSPGAGNISKGGPGIDFAHCTEVLIPS